MLIVADTTPIISLAKINQLKLLDSLYGDIILPEAVYNELIANPLMSSEAEMIKKCTFLKFKKVENEVAVKILQKQLNLGIGESEAIILADTLKADLLLMDEKKARGIAKNMGIRLTGTLGILVEAKRKNSIIKLKPYLDELIKYNIRISETLYKEILKLVNEDIQ